MSIKFLDKENQNIKQLVKTAWDRQRINQGEALFIPERQERPDELVNDADSVADPRLADKYHINLDYSNKAIRMKRSKRSNPPPIIAVDAGLVNLGSLARGGTVFAVRGAACLYTSEGQIIIIRYNTGAIPIDHANKLVVLHAMGKQLGDAEFFVKEIKDPPYLIEKSGVLETTDRVQDRFRNFVERIIQAEAIGILKQYNGGILLIDGALPERSYDTPKDYLLNQRKKKGMLYDTSQNGIDVVAISKKTRVTVEGIPIQNLLVEKYGADFVGYVPLKKIITEERKQARKSGEKVRAKVTMAKEVYAAKFGFGPASMTFRVDLHNCKGKLANEVIDDVYHYCRIYGGYPKPLIEAHHHSCFLFQDIQNLLADVTVKLGVKPEEEQNMNILFQPFGAFGK